MTVGKAGKAKRGLFAMLLASLIFTTGCGTFRRMEQWKCDHLGICQFGTTPTYETIAPPGSSYVVPYDAPCESCQE
jgi:hypothetical protein